MWIMPNLSRKITERFIKHRKKTWLKPYDDNNNFHNNGYVMKNLKFHLNEINSEPNEDFIDDIHKY